MARNYVAVCSIGLAIVISGCGARLPELVSPAVLPVDALIAAIRCELTDAIRQQARHNDDRRFLLKWQGAYTITLKGNETGTLAADANKFPVSFSSGSSVAVGAGADIKGAANRTALLKFDLNVADIQRYDQGCSQEAASSAIHPFLRGKIGFAEWLETALNASLDDPTISRHRDRISSIGHTFQFVVTANAGINPVFTIVPKPITLNPSISVSREEDNSVDVVLAPPAAKPDGPTVVIKVLTPEQLKQLADEISKRDNAKKKLAIANEFLESNDGKRLAGLQTQKIFKEAELTALQIAVPKDIFSLRVEQALPPNKQDDASRASANSVATSLKQITGQIEADKDYGLFLSSINARKEEPAKVSEAEKRIDEIKSDPQGVRTSRQRGGYASVQDNPNISSTSLQLTLERVLGRGRGLGF